MKYGGKMPMTKMPRMTTMASPKGKLSTVTPSKAPKGLGRGK